MKITYNAPVVLSIVFLSLFVLLAGEIPGIGETISGWFASPAKMDFASFRDWFRSFSWVFGHANWPHFLHNMLLIVLLGPMLEEKYGSGDLLIMILITAVVTSLINAMVMPLFGTYVSIVGMSGIVFMMILLSSLVNARQGELPMTFIIVALLYIGQEVTSIIRQDNVSQYAHIMGGVIGSIFGFILLKGSGPSAPTKPESKADLNAEPTFTELPPV